MMVTPKRNKARYHTALALKFYRHPQYSESQPKYRHEFDYSSLGLMLLDVGL